jgi:hypothetical protein
LTHVFPFSHFLYVDTRDLPGERLASFRGVSAASLAASLRRLMERRGAAMVTPRLIVTHHEEDWFTEMQEEQDALRRDREAARMAAEACWWLQPL